MSRIQLGLIGSALLLAGSFATTEIVTRADDPTKSNPVETKPLPAAASLPSPQTWPPGKVIFEQSETEKKIRAVLEQPAEFEFDNTPLGDVVEFIRKKYGLTVQVDTESLAADGKGEETPITKSIHEATLRNALSLILSGQGMTTVIKNDVLLVTTKAAASQPENQSVRTYQVHDLVVAPNDPTASQPEFDSLIELLTCSVRPSDWSDNGGFGFLRSYTGPGMLVLVATQNEEGHREIEQLLKSLRAARLQPIYDAQAQQPLPPPRAANVGGGGMVGGNTIPPTTTATPDNAAPATTSQQRGGGMF